MRLLTLFLVLASAPLFGQQFKDGLPTGQYELQVSRNGTLFGISMGGFIYEADSVYRFDASTQLWHLIAEFAPKSIRNRMILYDDLIIRASFDGAQTTSVIKQSGPTFEEGESGNLVTSINCLAMGYDSTIYAGTPYWGLLATRDLKTWDTLRSTTYFTWEQIDDLFITPTTIYMSTNSSVAGSTDNGNTWKQYSFGIPVKKLIAFRDTIYAIALGGKFLRGVDTLTVIGPTLPEPNWRNIFIADKAGALYYLSDNARIMCSRDGGYSWETLPPKGATSIACDSSGTVFVAINNVIFASTDHGVSFVKLSVDEKENETGVVYPNPVTDHCYVNGLSDGELVEIYSITGSKVGVKIYDNGLDLRNLHAGIYRLASRLGDRLIQAQIIKH